MAALQPRQTQSASDTFLSLVSNPFQAQVQANSIYASLVWSFAVSSLLFLTFCFLRPRNSAVYAPRYKYSDSKHKPPQLPKKVFSWLTSVRRQADENDLVDKIGLDAVVFLRFLRMCRNIFLVFAVLGCAVLIPVNVVGGHSLYSRWSNVATLMKFTPQYIFGQKFWAFVIMAYVFQGVVCGFVWWNYRAMFRLRRRYFESHDYRASLHSRTLLLTHIPENLRNDPGVAQVIDETKPTEDMVKTVISRSVKDLPELLEQHDKAIKQLESYLAKYLIKYSTSSDRPLCKIAKKDRSWYYTEEDPKKADAINYHTAESRKLELEIQAVRESLQSRKPLSYGFASFTHIEDAHAVAYAARKKGPRGSTIMLAPKPHDLLWRNLGMTRATRRTRMFWDGMVMILLTILFIPLNIITSVFLSDFSHLGLIWPSFRTNLAAHPVGWGIAQGILAPTVQFLFYLTLPTTFRRLYGHSGDVSKTRRERHVMSRLYAFFVFNNLVVFSIFGSVFRFVAGIIEAQDQDVWDAIKHAHIFTNLMTGLCNVSTFWLTYSMQQNLGAAVDLAQLWPLIWSSFRRKLSRWGWWALTPRQKIELSAPIPIDYATYYNTYLFISTVGFCFGTLQPIILPIAAFYMSIELWFKRYLLQYILFTKTESGGAFWRSLVNRLLFAVLLSNAVIALIVGAQGIGAHELIADTAANAGMLYTMIPLPFILLGFKWFLRRTFDAKMSYYTTSTVAEDPETAAEGRESLPKKGRKADRVAVRFGQPALYRKLLKPMVAADHVELLQNLHADLAPDVGGEEPQARPRSVLGFSDIYMGDLNHDTGKFAKPAGSTPNTTPGDLRPAAEESTIEVVPHANQDFAHFMQRTEFREQFGGEGELYGRPDDYLGADGSRPGTPSTFATLGAGSECGFGVKRKAVSRATTSGYGTRESSRTRIASNAGLDEEKAARKVERDEDRADGFADQGTFYNTGYQAASSHDLDGAGGDIGAQAFHHSRGSAEGADAVDVGMPSPRLDTRAILAAGERAGAHEEDLSYDAYRGRQ